MHGSNLRTPLTELFGIQHPVIQAPIGGASCPALAAAVSAAGGLGMLALSWTELEAIRPIVRQTRQLTERPFGINLGVIWPQKERLAACLNEGVRIISLFWGLDSTLIAQAKDGGALVLQTVGSADEAKQAVDMGADGIVAQGYEAGGHVWGSVGTFPLVPCVVDAIRPIPVVAAGGIADGRGLAAALALGAAGVWIGTRFLVSEEAAAHPAFQQALLDAKETDTVYSTLFDIGWPDAPHRTLHNETVATWEAAGRPSSGNRPQEGKVIARRADGQSVVRYSDDTPLRSMTGDVTAMALYAGQSVGLVGSIDPAGRIVEGIVAEAVERLKGLTSML